MFKLEKNLNFNDIQAMIPLYVKDEGNCTEIITSEGSIIESTTIETCIKRLADYYNISLYHNRVNYGSELGISNKVPIVINENKVFIYVNAREPLFRHDAAFGFVDINSIKKIYDNEIGAVIVMNSGSVIQTRQRLKMLKKGILLGRVTKDIYKEKHKIK